MTLSRSSFANCDAVNFVSANKAGQENCATKKVYKLSEIHSDLFDAESDSDAEKENKNSDESSCSDAENEAETEEKPDEGGDGEDDDEPIVMTAALKRKLKQVRMCSFIGVFCSVEDHCYSLQDTDCGHNFLMKPGIEFCREQRKNRPSPGQRELPNLI